MSKVHRGTQEERDEAIAALLVGVIPRAGGAYRGPPEGFHTTAQCSQNPLKG